MDASNAAVGVGAVDVGALPAKLPGALPAAVTPPLGAIASVFDCSNVSVSSEGCPCSCPGS